MHLASLAADLNQLEPNLVEPVQEDVLVFMEKAVYGREMGNVGQRKLAKEDNGTTDTQGSSPQHETHNVLPPTVAFVDALGIRKRRLPERAS